MPGLGAFTPRLGGDSNSPCPVAGGWVREAHGGQHGVRTVTAVDSFVTAWQSQHRAVLRVCQRAEEPTGATQPMLMRACFPYRQPQSQLHPAAIECSGAYSRCVAHCVSPQPTLSARTLPSWTRTRTGSSPRMSCCAPPRCVRSVVVGLSHATGAT